MQLGDPTTCMALDCVGDSEFLVNVSLAASATVLPEEVVSAPTLSSFRRRLKPFLFQQSYPDVVI